MKLECDTHCKQPAKRAQRQRILKLACSPADAAIAYVGKVNSNLAVK